MFEQWWRRRNLWNSWTLLHHFFVLLLRPVTASASCWQLGSCPAVWTAEPCPMLGISEPSCHWRWMRRHSILLTVVTVSYCVFESFALANFWLTCWPILVLFDLAYREDQVRFLRVLENQKRALAEGAGWTQAMALNLVSTSLQNTSVILLQACHKQAASGARLNVLYCSWLFIWILYYFASESVQKTTKIPCATPVTRMVFVESALLALSRSLASRPTCYSTTKALVDSLSYEAFRDPTAHWAKVAGAAGFARAGRLEVQIWFAESRRGYSDQPWKFKNCRLIILIIQIRLA